MERFSMDHMTAKFYESYVQQGAADSEASHSAISKYFQAAFKEGDKVLDVGSGSGRDLAVLIKTGVDAYGIEPNDAMRKYALTKHPELAGRVKPDRLPLTHVPFGGGFDGVLCSAVLMHIPEDCFIESWKSILQVLKPTAKVLFSLPSMQPGLLQDRRDRDDRFFENHRVDLVSSMLKSCGFIEIDLGTEATSVYPDITWTISLFESTTPGPGGMRDAT
ncbi:methyltransferase domain-containing protein [Janthinobacterium aquaticum]|nr:methyltransferase domain-containing protein [Janthinobacterium sp. FT58W]